MYEVQIIELSEKNKKSQKIMFCTPNELEWAESNFLTYLEGLGVKDPQVEFKVHQGVEIVGF